MLCLELVLPPLQCPHHEVHLRRIRFAWSIIARPYMYSQTLQACAVEQWSQAHVGQKFVASDAADLEHSQRRVGSIAVVANAELLDCEREGVLHEIGAGGKE